MPRGTTHVETGRLRETEGRWTLRRDGGGEWRLDLGWRSGARLRAMQGGRVRVRGCRDGFDLLAVRSVEAVDE